MSGTPPPDAAAPAQSFAFVPAVTIRRKLRMCLVGYEGTGKTYTALDTARALAGPDGRIAVIDTEGAQRFADGSLTSSSAIYAGRFGPFDVLVLTDHTPENYAGAMEAAAAAGYSVIIIDSLSHEYVGAGGLLEVVDAAKARGGYGWDIASPRHRRVFEAIVASPAHVIATMRQRKAYVQEQQGNRTRMRQVGTEPVQREGAEFEFDLVATMDHTHTLTVTKSREMPDLPAGKTIGRPEGKLIAALATRSLGVGADAPAAAVTNPAPPPPAATPPASPSPAARPARRAGSPAPDDPPGWLPLSVRVDLDAARGIAHPQNLAAGAELVKSLGYASWGDLYTRGSPLHAAAILATLAGTPVPVPA